MPSVQEVGKKTRGDLDVAAQRAQAVVEVLDGELTRMARDASQRARTASQAVAQVQADLNNLLSADSLPSEFTGVIHDYRFGMFGEPPVNKTPAITKDKKVKPSHRFEVEVPGAGLWLHVRCSSADFEEFLMDASVQGEEDGTFDPKTLNGKTITVRRDIKNNKLVPIGLGTITKEILPLGKDKSGNLLFKGDMVRIKERFSDRSYKATILDFTNNTWIYQRPDRKNPTKRTQSQINVDPQFEKIDKDGNPVKQAPAFPTPSSLTTPGIVSPLRIG